MGSKTKHLHSLLISCNNYFNVNKLYCSHILQCKKFVMGYNKQYAFLFRNHVLYTTGNCLKAVMFSKFGSFINQSATRPSAKDKCNIHWDAFVPTQSVVLTFEPRYLQMVYCVQYKYECLLCRTIKSPEKSIILQFHENYFSTAVCWNLLHGKQC